MLSGDVVGYAAGNPVHWVIHNLIKFVSWGWYNDYHKCGGLKDLLTFSQFWSQEFEVKALAGCAPFEDAGGGPFLLFSPPETPGVPWLVATSPSLPPPSAGGFPSGSGSALLIDT